MHDAPTIDFEDFVKRLKKTSAASVSGENLVVPQLPDPFVPQTATVDHRPHDESPLDSDIIIFTAPAAVGKSTFARALAAKATVPFLDLAKVRVATHSLRGILSAELGTDGPNRLQRGTNCVIIDALDEGRILSGEKNFEEFLNTTFELLVETPGEPRCKEPRLVMFGRTAAVELASIVLELYAPDLTVSSLTIDYFDENAATALILEHARRIEDPDKIDRFEVPIRETIKTFFDAIGAAIGSAPDGLWQDSTGRAFVGYAPVLAALGTLIGGEDNYAKLQQRLRETGIRDAWGVLQEVADQVLTREAKKVNKPLRDAWGDAVPLESYDPSDQLDLLTAFLCGRPTGPSPRLAFRSSGASGAYREAVRMHLPEHPFLRDGIPVNEVLGSYVLAHAIAKGVETTGGQAPSLLAAYGRQPFLWRFCRRLIQDDSTIISGDQVSYMLGSYWSDDSLVANETTIKNIDGEKNLALLRVEGPTNGISAQVLLPLTLRGEIRNISVQLPEEEVLMSGWPDAETRSMLCIGDVQINTGTLAFDLDWLQVGGLSTSASCHLTARQALRDQQLNLEVQSNSSLIIGGSLVGRFPWDTVAETEASAPTDDPIWELLSDCTKYLPRKLPVVVFTSFELTNDPRLDWARRHQGLFPRLLRTLVNNGFARKDTFPSGEDPKMRVRPNLQWSELKAAYTDTNKTNQELRRVFEEL